MKKKNWSGEVTKTSFALDLEEANIEFRRISGR